ncbi:hypothetical protein [Streptomyces sp. NPDC004008]
MGTDRTLTLFVESGYRLYSGDDSQILDADLPDPAHGTPLIDILPDHTYALVSCATQWADITLTYQILDQAPPVDTDGWNEVHDVSLLLQPPEDEEMLTGLALEGTSSGESVEAIPLNCHNNAPTWWRMRLHTKNQDTEHATESHLLTFWPAPQTPPVVHKTASKT